MNREKKNIKVLISGGGTGGHIFPAISIANALKKNAPEIEILFVGAEGKMEMEKVPAAGYKILALPVAGFPRKPSLKMISFFIKLFKSLLIARKIIKTFKPDIAVGVGGYASGPALRMAARQKVPIVLQEQNSYPGITNQILGKKAQKIFVAYDNMERYFDKNKIIFTGNPIRQDIQNTEITKGEAYQYFGLSSNKRTVFITGGSLGALTLNDSVYQNINTIIENDIQIIWQTGKNYIEKAKILCESLNSTNIYVNDFVYRMDLAYLIADLIIARAGASTISELCVIGKPVILVPSPNVAEDHQTKNAMALSSINAAILIKDSEAREILIQRAIELISNKTLSNILEQSIVKLAKTDAAEVIANQILEIVYEK